MIARRAFALAVGGAILAMPLAGAAQQTGKIPVVGVLAPTTVPAFIEKLSELGYQDGRNVQLVVRSADGKLGQLAALAVELVQRKPDVIVSVYTPATRAAINATKEIPIVMALVGDPVAAGFVSNLPHPGGNVTGVSSLDAELAAKRLQLLKETIPAVRRIAVLLQPDNPTTGLQRREIERAAPQIGVEVGFFPVRTEEGLIAAFKQLTDWRAEGMLWLVGDSAPFMPASIGFALEHRLPTMVATSADAQAGGLISYRPDAAKLWGRVAVLADKILKGAKPGDLPVEQPTTFELVINLKTAQALRLTVPHALLLRADAVIE